MLVDLLRHGAALAGAPGGTDSDRELSAEGREQVKGVVERALAAGTKPSLIICSPYRRARETAEIAAAILGYAGALERNRALEPDRSPFDIWDEVRRRDTESEILLVSHLPLLGELALLLTKRSVRIYPGTMVRIAVPELVPEPGGTLEWMLP
jgi:phosphohistidine phosphatase